MLNSYCITSQDLHSLKIGDQFGISKIDNSDNKIHDWIEVIDIQNDKIICMLINGMWKFFFDKRNPHIATSIKPDGAIIYETSFGYIAEPQYVGRDLNDSEFIFDFVLNITYFDLNNRRLKFDWQDYDEAIKFMNLQILQNANLAPF